MDQTFSQLAPELQGNFLRGVTSIIRMSDYFLFLRVCSLNVSFDSGHPTSSVHHFELSLLANMESNHGATTAYHQSVEIRRFQLCILLAK